MGAYYCRFDATGATYTGAYGWSGTAEVTDEDVISTVWTNIESFEVTDSDQDLGNNTLHFVVQ